MVDCEWEGESTIWFWTEGNYGCDCNRYLLFQRAAEESEDDEIECGWQKYHVLGFILTDGRCVPNFDDDRVIADA